MLADIAAEIERLDTAGKVGRVRVIEAELRRLEAELAVAVGDLESEGVHRVDGHASLRGFLPR